MQWAAPVDQVLADLGTSRHGLTDAEAAARLERHGPSRLLINTLIGFITELRERRAMEALLRLDASTATVVRGGAAKTIDARGLVPGDVIALEAGANIPADARVIAGAELRATRPRRGARADRCPRVAPRDVVFAHEPGKTNLIAGGNSRQQRERNKNGGSHGVAPSDTMSSPAPYATAATAAPSPSICRPLVSQSSPVTMARSTPVAKSAKSVRATADPNRQSGCTGRMYGSSGSSPATANAVNVATA